MDEQTNQHFYTRIDLLGLMVASEGKVPAEIELMKVGSYKSYAYSDFEITEADLVGFVESFERGIRAKGENGEDKSLPINFSHKMYDEAAGWITSVRAANGSLLAKVEWTDVGEAALKNKRYKYISPEWYFAYQDETTGAQYRNVLAGAGLTNVPLFQKLKPLTSTEGDVILLDNPMSQDKPAIAPTLEKPQPTRADAEPVTPSANDAKPTDTSKSVDTSTQQPNTAAEKKNEDNVVLTAAEHQAMMVRLSSLETENRKNRIEQEVGQMVASATTPGKFYPAQRDAAVDLLIAAEGASKEIADKVRDFISKLPDQSLHAGEQGSSENKEVLTASEELTKLVNKTAKEQNISVEQAKEVVRTENPELYKRYMEEED